MRPVGPLRRSDLITPVPKAKKRKATTGKAAQTELARAKTAAEWSKSFGHDFKPEQVNCSGCTSDGAHIGYCESMCEIRKCARSRKLDNCAACAAYGCATITGFHKNAPEAKTRLDAVRAKLKER